MNESLNIDTESLEKDLEKWDVSEYQKTLILKTVTNYSRLHTFNISLFIFDRMKCIKRNTLKLVLCFDFTKEMELKRYSSKGFSKATYPPK